jgi:hypothetical protein
MQMSSSVPAQLVLACIFLPLIASHFMQYLPDRLKKNADVGSVFGGNLKNEQGVENFFEHLFAHETL